MRGNGVSLYGAVLSKIVSANQDGYRLVIPSCFRVAFSEEQSLTVVANADRVVERDDEARVTIPAQRAGRTNSRVTPDDMEIRPTAM